MDSTRRQNTQLDRLSALPNSVLTHILSFLPTKQAASTSILSKPWRNIWISIPDLEFDDSCLAGHFSCLSHSHDQERSFVQSINRLFLLRENSIRRFNLRCLNGCNSLFISSWISLARLYEPSEVNVEVRAKNLSPVPSAIFAGGNLVKIELSGSILIDVKDFTVSLPSIKNLRLDNVRYTSTGSIEKIVSGCPVLEDLDIVRSEEDEDLVLNITAPGLRSLRISFEDCDNLYLDDVLEYVLVINAPNIEELHLNDKVTKKYIVKDGLWSFLCEADVDVKDDASAFAVFKALANATDLCFSGDSLVNISWDEEQYNMPVFLNLSRLELGIEDACLDLVNMFLLSSPNLEVLIFKKESKCGYRDPLWTSPSIVPICLRQKLKIICFEHLLGNKYELRMIKYLLQNARVMHHMIVQCPKITESLARQLNNFQRHGNLHLIS